VLEWLLFPKPQQRAYIGSLSGGERRRLYLLFVLMRQPNVLLLDEPTNDLDIQTLNILEEFLDEFSGSLVAVSHDRYFLDRNVDFIVEFSDGQVSPRYPAPYSTFVQLRGPGASPASSSPKKSRPAPATDSVTRQSQSRKLTWQEQRELERLETRLEQLETEKSEIQQQINRAGDDYRQLQTLAQTLQTVEAELEQISERWLELQELMDGKVA
jgi:ATP-binding cassette subfamily F protein uup